MTARLILVAVSLALWGLLLLALFEQVVVVGKAMLK
jgi:hypothetical protein